MHLHSSYRFLCSPKERKEKKEKEKLEKHEEVDLKISFDLQGASSP